MLIYRITNTVNDKVYIGKTVKANARQRWREHVAQAVRRSASTYLHQAIRKYGSDVFNVEVLHYAKTAEELSKMETFFIVLHQSHKPENGYNLTLGGEGILPPYWTGKKRPPYSQGWCSKIGLAAKGRKMPLDAVEKTRQAKLGKSLSAAHCEAISASNREYFQNNSEPCLERLTKARDILLNLYTNDPSFKPRKNAAIRVAWTSEIRAVQSARMSASRRNTGYVKPVCCIDTGEIFPTVRDAAKAFGEQGSNLSRAIKHGYLFFGKRWEYVQQPVA